MSSEKFDLPYFLQILNNLEHSRCYYILMVKVNDGLTAHTKTVNFKRTNIREIRLTDHFIHKKSDRHVGALDFFLSCTY